MNMTKPTKTIFSTVAVCLVIALASVSSVNASDDEGAFDVPKEHKKHQHQKNSYQENRHIIKRMVKALSLSEAQQIQIKAIKTQARQQKQTLRASMKQFKIAEKKLLQTKAFDEQAYSALHDTYQPVFTELALIRVKNKHAIFNVLTVKQQEKWLKIIENHRGNAKKFRG